MGTILLPPEDLGLFVFLFLPIEGPFMRMNYDMSFFSHHNKTAFSMLYG